MTEPTKAIIFDFDGTIADSFDVFLEALGAITKRRKPLTSEDIERLRKSTVKEIIKKLDVKFWQMPLFFAKGRREINARFERVRAFDGMPQALKELSSNYSVYILSSNSEENISKFLKKYGISDHVKMIRGDIGLMGKAKNLKKLQKREALKASNCVYIGDETRDIEAARKVGMKCIAVKWGYSNPDMLRSHASDALVDAPENLAKTIGEQMA